MRPVIACLATAMLGLGSAGSQAENYLVLYAGSSVPASATKLIQTAGGVAAYTYPQIGVVLARSNSTSFASALRTLDRNVEGVSATSAFRARVDGLPESSADDVVAAGSPAPWGSEPLSHLQWDMVQIGVPEAHAISGGSPSIIVGDLDSGVDFSHPDLQSNVDFTRSVSCMGGVPNTDPAAWYDDNGHGTHTAGTIAAAVNGIGMVGVAPNVKLAAVKVIDANGFIFPEAAICGFVWAGRSGSTSRTTATSSTPGTSTAATTPSSARSGKQCGARSVTRSRAAWSSWPRSATRTRTCPRRIPTRSVRTIRPGLRRSAR